MPSGVYPRKYTGINKNCIVCNKEFYVQPSGLKRKTCSKSCGLRTHKSNMLGYKHSMESKNKISKSSKGKPNGRIGIKLSEEHKNKLRASWKLGKRIKCGWGEYAKAHRWIVKQLGKPMICSHCFNVNAKRYDWANISGEYKWELSDWRRLCVKCHLHSDRKGELPCLIQEI